MLIDRAIGQIQHYHARDLPEIIRPGDALVMNNSKVIPARLVGRRTSTGGRWEGLYLREDSSTFWEILSKTRGYMQPGETISLMDREGRESPTLEVVSRLDQGHLAVRKLDAEVSTLDLLQRFGRVPLPPYIRDGQMVDRDWDCYQTVYAKQAGSVAAPTAGLHFTRELIHKLLQLGAITVPVTLHVGLGTFRPVAVQNLSDHVMHREWGELPQSSVDKLAGCRQRSGRTIAVGTTSVRVLESAARANSGTLMAWQGETDIFIRPPYQFKWVDGLLTNFHLPRSTLLTLVCALAGHELVMQAYRTAIEQKYRFYSYGDCMLIL
jgi:S-adenosylmethionine:tRNA ribosyltransferase-isomerase